MIRTSLVAPLVLVVATLCTAACDPVGIWNDVLDGPDGSDEDEGDDTGEGEGEGEGEGDLPLAPCCDLVEVALPDDQDVVGFAVNRAGVAHFLLQKQFTTPGAPQPVSFAIASAGGLTSELVEATASPAVGFSLSFDDDGRALATRSTSGGATLERRDAPGTWTSLELVAAPGTFFVANTYAARPLGGGAFGAAVELGKSESPGEGSCPSGNFTVCSTHEIAIGRVDDPNDPVVARDIPGQPFPLALGLDGSGRPVLAYAAGVLSDVFEAHEIDGVFSSTSIATGLVSPDIEVGADGAVVVVGVELPADAPPRLVLLESGAAFTRTVLVEDVALQTHGIGLAVEDDGTILVSYSIEPTQTEGGILRLARKRGDLRDDVVVAPLATGLQVNNVQIAGDGQDRVHVLFNESDTQRVLPMRYLAPR